MAISASTSHMKKKGSGSLCPGGPLYFPYTALASKSGDGSRQKLYDSKARSMLTDIHPSFVHF